MAVIVFKTLFLCFVLISMFFPPSHTITEVDPALLCSTSSCSGGCPTLPEECIVQNSTHSGHFLPSPALCNCCKYCLVNLLPGDTCSQGSLGSPPNGAICGPGLSCKQDGKKSTCQRMDSVCHSAQDKYDEMREDGTLGFLQRRAFCDEEGKYGPAACVPGQTCFCLSRDGERIFGEALNQKSVGSEMKCGCSRADDLMQTLLGVVHGRRCLEDGSFDPLQCIGNRCFCVNKVTGEMMDDDVIDLATQKLTKLNCFDSSIHHSATSYLRQCEEERQEMLLEVEESEREGYTTLSNPLPACQLDGNYQSVQIKGDRKICVTAAGDPILNFGADLTSEKAVDMDCKCARSFHLISSSPGSVTPSCCENGSWRPLQCRGGMCYCADSDGQQVGLEQPFDAIKDLPCYTENWTTC